MERPFSPCFSPPTSRYTGQSELIVGATAAQRNRPELHNLVGYLLNTLPIRSRIEGKEPFLEFLDRVHGDCRDAIAHQDIRYQHLVARLNPARDQYGRPLFQALFALTNSIEGVIDLPDVTCHVRRPHAVGVKADVSLYLSPSGSDLAGRLEYSTNLFVNSTIKGISDAYGALLGSIVDDPDRTIDSLDLLTSAEREMLLAEQASNVTDYSRGSSLVELFEAKAAARPDSEALRWSDGSWSYKELNAEANRFAHRLLSLGVGPDVLVGLCGDRSPWLIAGMLGIVKAGGAYVPLDPSYPAERLGFMLEDTGAPAVLADAGLIEDIDLGQAVRLDLNAQSQQPDDTNPDRVSSPNDLAYVMYTSGSTGTPKGVEVTHRNVVRLVRDTNYVELGPTKRILQLAPTSFDAATFEIWGALLNGGVCVLFPERTLSLEVLERELRDNQINCLWLTASLYNDAIDNRPTALESVDQLLIGGEALSVPHVLRGLELLPATQIINGYGPTEGTTFSCCYSIPREGTAARSSIPIGSPISNTRAYILDQRGSPVPPGMSGELYIGGDGIARGYHRRPELTDERFIPDPFSDEPGAQLYRTGDRVRRLEDGSIDYMGRFDTQVKIRGFRIEPGEVEACVDSHTLVRQSIVRVYQTPAGEKALVAYVLGERDAEPITRAELLSHLKGRLPDFMIPAIVVPLDTFPLTPSGKVDCHALPEPDLDAIVAREYVAPKTDLEVNLAKAWQEVLKIDLVGTTDDFFELGGNSLQALHLIREVKAFAGVRVDLPMVFDAPTVRDLATTLETTGAVSETATALTTSSWPVTQRQALVWIANSLHPDVPLNRTTTLFSIRGTIDPQVFKRAFSDLVAHHEALRATIDDPAQGLRYRVREDENRAVELVDLSGQSDPEQAYRLWLERRCIKRFPAGECLYDAALIKLGDDHFVFYLNQNHVITDGASCIVLHKNLEALYLHYAGQPMPAADFEALGQPSFSEFIDRFDRYINSNDSVPSEAFWTEKFTSTPPPPRFFGRSGRKRRALSRRVRRRLDPSISQKIHTMGPLTPPFLAFATVLFAYLRRFTPSSFAGFPADYEPTTPLNIVEELADDREPSNRCTGRDALTVNIKHAGHGGEFVVSFDFNLGIWPDPAERDRAVDHFVSLTEAFVEDRQMEIDAVDLLTPSERDWLLPAAEPVSPGDPTLPTVLDLFAAQVARGSDRAAVVSGEREMTYGELNSRVQRLSAYLRDRGVGKDMLVGVCVDRSPDMVVPLLAVMQVGGAYVPIDPDHPASRINLMIEDAEPVVLVTESKLRNKLGDHRQDRVVLLDNDPWLAAAPDEIGPQPGELA